MILKQAFRTKNTESVHVVVLDTLDDYKLLVSVEWLDWEEYKAGFSNITLRRHENQYDLNDVIIAGLQHSYERLTGEYISADTLKEDPAYSWLKDWPEFAGVDCTAPA